MPNSRGSAAPARAASAGRRPSSSAASQAMIAERTSPPPVRRNGSGGRRGTLPRRERQSRPLVVGAERERREDPAAEPARTDAVSRVAGAVVDPRPGLRAEERQMVGGNVDRPAPRPLDSHAGEPRQQARAGRLGARGRRHVEREAVVDTAAESDRPGAAAHQHASVVRRPEVVEEHPPVDDRLTAGPADLGADSGAGSVSTTYEPKFVRLRDAGRQRLSAAFVASTISRARMSRRASQLVRGAGAEAVTGVRSCTVTPASSAARRNARTSSPGWTVAPSRKNTPRAKHRRCATRCATSSRESGTASSMLPTRPRPRQRSRRRVLRRRGRTSSSRPHAAGRPRLAPRARTHAGHDRLRRSREPTASSSPSTARRRERRPVAVEKATVSPARPCAADLGLEQRHAQARDRAHAARAPSRGRCSRRRRSRRRPSRLREAGAGADRPRPRAPARATRRRPRLDDGTRGCPRVQPPAAGGKTRGTAPPR